MKLSIDLAGVLRKQRNQTFPLQHALLELIDNSVDEGSTNIQIRENNGDLIISDNGCGFSDIGAALIVGKSSKSDSIGRYGVGLKDACVRYSDSTTIESNGVRVMVPWLDIMEGVVSGELEPDRIADAEGITRIVLHGFRGRYTQAIQTQEIQRVYHPLIDTDGLEIDVNGALLEPLKMPTFTEVINKSFDYKGKSVTITGGIYPSNDPTRQIWKGYNPYYKGRLIGPGKITNRGTGDECCTSFMFMVHLRDSVESWTLATNKDAVEGLGDLLDHIYYEYTRETLIRGAEASMDIELKAIEDNINRVLSGRNGNITRRKSGEKPGTVKPTESGPPKQRTNTARDAGGYINDGGSAKRSSLRFKFEDLGGESLCAVDRSGKGLIITANLNNSFIAENKTNEPACMCLAKLAHAAFRSLEGNDLAVDEIMSRIMCQAGEELSYTQNKETTTS